MDIRGKERTCKGEGEDGHMGEEEDDIRGGRGWT